MGSNNNNEFHIIDPTFIDSMVLSDEQKRGAIMFVELIAQGKEMIRRFEGLVGLSAKELSARPEYQKVAFKEVTTWQKTVEERIRTTFGTDAVFRYNNIVELYKDDVKRDEGDEITRALNLLHRIVTLISEFQERLNLMSSSRSPCKVPTISILFLAADPTDATRLRLGKEFQEIQEILSLAGDRFKLELPQMAVRADIISQVLLTKQPQIVHFSGHGASTGELAFENLIGVIQPVQPEALRDLFKQFTSHVNCVLLNACFSDKQAKAISENINYVIGMNQKIDDKAAIAFTTGFYQALSAGRSIEEAFELGRVQIRLQNIPDYQVPILFKKNQIQIFD